jgi:hypothetical protein
VSIRRLFAQFSERRRWVCVFMGMSRLRAKFPEPGLVTT